MKLLAQAQPWRHKRILEACLYLGTLEYSRVVLLEPGVLSACDQQGHPHGFVANANNCYTIMLINIFTRAAPQQVALGRLEARG